MSPQDLSLDDLRARGRQFFYRLDDCERQPPRKPEDAALTAACREALGRRGLFETQDDGSIEIETGRQLYQAFVNGGSVRTDAGNLAAQQRTGAEDVEGTARTWLRDLHAEIVAIRRGNSSPVLKRLPTLNDLQDPTALAGSLGDVLDFLANAEVGKVLKRYRIGSREIEQGKTYQDQLARARGEVAGGRGLRSSATSSHVEAHQAFRSWLGIWWGIAKVQMKDRPWLWEALGIDATSRRSRSKVPVAQVPDAIASTHQEPVQA